MIPFIVLLIAACDHSQLAPERRPDKIQEKIIGDDNFLKAIDLLIDVNSEISYLKDSGYTDREIDQVVKDKTLTIQSLYNELENDYANFKENAELALKNNSEVLDDLFQNKSKNARYDPASLCGVTEGPCTDQHSGVHSFVLGCKGGCLISEMHCVQQGGEVSFCSSVEQACTNACCDRCNTYD